MYGMPGNRFGGSVVATTSDDVRELVKESQVLQGEPTRTFVAGDASIDIGWDGAMFLLFREDGADAMSEDELASLIPEDGLYTRAV